MKRFIGRIDIVIGIIIVAGFIVYSNSFRNDFAYDDFIIVAGNEFIQDLNNLPLIFSSKYFILAREGVYRPVVTLTYFLDFYMGGLDLPVWHLTNLFFLCASAVLIFLLSAEILKERAAALIAALFFVVHPVNSETVNFIVSRPDLLCGFFFYLAFWLYIKYLNSGKRYLYALCLFSFIMSLFSKEMGIVLLPTVLLYDICFTAGDNKRNRLIRYAGLSIVLAAYLLCRFTVLSPVGNFAGVDFSQARAYPGGNLFYTLLTFAGVIIYYIKLLILPLNLTVDYSWFPAVTSFRDISAYFPALMLAAVIFLVFKARRFSGEMFFSAAYFFAALLPVSNIVPFWALLAERYLFIPAFGFFLFSGAAALKIYGALEKTGRGGVFKNAFLLLLAGLFIFYSERTFLRNYDWKDSETLWQKTAREHPTAKAYLSLADTYKRYGDSEKAMEYYNIVIATAPYNDSAYFGAAEIYFEKKEYGSAIKYYEKTIQTNPVFIEAFYRLEKLYRLTGNESLAEKYLEQAELLDPGRRPGVPGAAAMPLKGGLKSLKTSAECCALGVSLYKNGETEKAFEYLKRGVELDPGSAECYYNLGLFYGLQEDIEKGIANLEKAVSLNPGFLLARYNLGVLYARKKYYGKAIEEFKYTLKAEPNNVEALYYLGLVYLNQDKPDAAKEVFSRVLKIDPGHVLARAKYDHLNKQRGSKGVN